MKRLFLVLSMAVVILPWLNGAKAQADAIQWTASGTVQTAYTGTIEQGAGGDVPALPEPLTPGGIGMHSGGNTSGTNFGSVVLAQLSTYQTNFGFQSVSGFEFGGPLSHYQLSLVLRDQASGSSGTLTFNGFFGGELDVGGSGGDLTNTYVGPTNQSLKLGSNLYTVTIGPAVLPQNIDGFTWPNTGSISASIAVQPAANATTPEPSSLVLACLGLPSLGLARWLRRRPGSLLLPLADGQDGRRLRG